MAMSVRYRLGTARRIFRRRFRRRPWVASGALSGLRFRLPPGFEYFVVYHEYEPQLVQALARLVRPGFVCVDAGANVGVLTLHLARLVGPEGRVVAFEAAPENAEQLRANVALNPELLSRVVVEQAAVTDGTARSIDLFPGRGGGHSGWTVSEHFAARSDVVATERIPTRVRAISLDHYFPPSARLDLVKMDIEGGEAEALPGMSRLMREARPIVVLEFHREAGWAGVQALLEANYQLEDLDGRPLAVPRGTDDVPYQLVARPGV